MSSCGWADISQLTDFFASGLIFPSGLYFPVGNVSQWADISQRSQSLFPARHGREPETTLQCLFDGRRSEIGFAEIGFTAVIVFGLCGWR